MSQKKSILKVSSLIGCFIAVIPSTLLLTSCNFNFPSYFTIGTPNDVFLNSKVSMGGPFVDAPSTTNFNSIYGRLVNYFTEGDYEYENGKLVSSPETFLRFELATKLEIEYIDKTSTGNAIKTVVIDGKNPTEDFFIKKDNFVTNNLDVKKIGIYLLNATKIKFVLNDQLKWIDKNQKEHNYISAFDFWCGLASYKNSVDLQFNKNGYFLSLSGIDFDKTIKDPSNFDLKPGSAFTFYMSETKPSYFLDVLTKQYFFPIPNQHPEAGSVIFSQGDKIPDWFKKQLSGMNVVKKNSDSNTIDIGATDWTKVYGADQKNNLDIWTIGPYIPTKISLQDVTFEKNENYFNNVDGTNKNVVDKQINKVVLKYKAGSPEVLYNRFKSGELSYIPVPPAQSKDAVNNFDETILKPLPAPKTTQGNFMSYNMGIFANDGSLKNSDLKNWEKFIINFNTEDGLNIRKGLNQLINWGRIAEKKFGPGIKDTHLSSIPYGVFDVEGNDFYHLIDENKMIENQKLNGLFGGFYSEMKEKSDYLFINENKIKNNIEQLTFIDSLKKIGYTKENPLVMEFWTLSQANDPKDIAYYGEIEKQIQILSNGLMKFEYIPYSQTTNERVYLQKSVTSGSFLWSPDYNAIGTWVGTYFSFEYDEKGDPKIIKLKNNGNKEVLVPSYHFANLWEALYNDLKKVSDSATDIDSLWKLSLKKHLSSKNAANFESNKTYKDIKSNLDTEIAIWSGTISNIKGKSINNGLHLIQWIDSQAPIIPTATPGINYQSFKLVDPNYQVILNLNGDLNYRDFLKK